MRYLKDNLLLQFSVVSFIIMLLLAVAVSSILAEMLAYNLNLIEQHDAAMQGDVTINDSDPASIASISRHIVLTRWLTYGAVGGGFLILYGSLVLVVGGGWRTITRKRDQLQLINTELAEAYEQVTRSERRYRELYNNAPDMYHTLDLEGNFTEFNSRYTEELGYSREDLEGQHVSCIMTEAMGPKLSEDFQWLQETGRLAHREYELRRKDGSLLTVEVKATRFDNPDGRPKEIHCAMRDITERKRAEEVIKESEERYKRLVENAADALFVHDLEGKFLEVNQQACASLGYRREELLTLSVPDIEQQFNTDKVQELLKKVRGGATLTAAGVHRRKDGTTFPVEVRIGSFMSGGSQFVLCTARDVTERKRAEEALKESEKRYQRASSAGRVGVWDWEIETNQMYLDLNLKAMLGYEDHEISNSWEEWLKLVHPDDVERVEEAVKEHLEGTATAYEVERRMLHRDGSVKWFLCRGTTDRDTAGRPMRMIGSDTDITEIKQVEEALRESEQAQRQLAEENALLNEVARIITSTLDIEEVYQRFAIELKKLVEFDRLTTNIIDRESGVFIPTYQSGLYNPERQIGVPVPLEGTMSEQVLLTGQTLVREDIRAGDTYEGDQARIAAGIRSMAQAPLVSNGSVIGTMCLFSRRVGAYGPGEQAILECLANHIAPAVENARLYDELQASSQEMAVVAEVARIISSTLDIDQVYEKFALEMKKLVDFDRVNINIIDYAAEAQQIRYLYGVGAAESHFHIGDILPLANSQSQQVILTGRTLILDDWAAASQFKTHQYHVSIGMRSSIHVPLINKGRIFGTLNVRSSRPAAYGPKERVILEHLANHVAPAIENARLYEELQARTQEMGLVDEVARIITSTLNINQVCEEFTHEMKKLVDFNRASVSLVDEEAGTFTLTYVLGEPRPGRTIGLVTPLEGSQTGQVVRAGKTLVRSDISSDLSFRDDQAHLDLGLYSSIALPLISKGRVIGSLVLRSSQMGAYGSREQEILERLAKQIAPAIENGQLYEELQASTQEMAVADEVARIITSTLQIDQVYERFSDEMEKLVQFDRASINLADQEAGSYALLYLSGSPRPGNPVGSILPLEGTETGHVVETSQTLVVEDISSGLRYSHQQELLDMGLNASIKVPLITKGRTIGTINLWSRQLGAYGRREQAILERLASQIAPAIENSQLYEQTKRAEQEARLQSEIAKNMAEGVCLIRPSDCVITYANRRFEQMFGYEQGELAGKGGSVVAAPGQMGPKEIGQEITKSLSKRGVWRGEIHNIKKDGATFWSYASVSTFEHYEFGNVWVAILTDITERKLAEQALRESEQRIRDLAAESVRAHEEERQRSALEVHDRIAQPLAAVFQQIQVLKDQTLSDPDIGKLAERASVLLQEAIRESRNIMNDLYPAGLDEFGIAALMEDELESFAEDTGCPVSFNPELSMRLPNDVEIVFYRIFHEAFINVRRHAPTAASVAVSIGYSDQVATLQIHDDGPGFDVKTATADNRVGGLMSMRRRAEVIGGTLEISSSPSKGTTLTVRVPIQVGNPQRK